MKRMLLTVALLTLSSAQAGGMDMAMPGMTHMTMRSEEHTSELQSH